MVHYIEYIYFAVRSSHPVLTLTHRYLVDVGERPGACGGSNCHPLCKWEHVDDIKHTGEIVKYRILSDKMPRSVGFEPLYITHLMSKMCYFIRI